MENTAEPARSLQKNAHLNEDTFSSHEVYNGALLHVHKDVAILPNGERSVREWIKHPGASAVVPLFENGDTLLLRQFRYPVKHVFYEVPAGKLDPNEAPEVTAARELEEEAGLRCSQLDYVGHYYPCIGYSDEIIYFYLARGLESVAKSLDDDEFVEPFRVSLETAIEMIYTGDITDGKTALCLLRARDFLTKNG